MRKSEEHRASHVLLPALFRPIMKLDAVDLRILGAIQRQGRITKVALAERVGLSPTPCWTRLRRLERAGIIAGYHAHLSLRLMAPVTAVFVEVTLGGHRKGDFDRFEQAVKDTPEIVACWALGGGIDYALKVVTPDVDAYQRLIDGLLAREIGIDRYFSYIVTRTVKEETEMPLAALLAGLRED